MATCFSKPFFCNSVTFHSLMNCVWIFQITMTGLSLQQTVLSIWLLYVKNWSQPAPVPPNTIFYNVTHSLYTAVFHCSNHIGDSGSQLLCGDY